MIQEYTFAFVKNVKDNEPDEEKKKFILNEENFDEAIINVGKCFKDPEDV